MSHRVLLSSLHAVRNGDVLDRDAAQQIVERVLRRSQADGASVVLQSSREANVRFADNQMSTSGVTVNTTVRVQSVFGKRKASVVTNDLSDDGLRRAVEQSEAIARLAPEDPEYLGELSPQTHEAVDAWFDSTALLSAEDRARAAMTALGPARASNDLTVAGFLVTTESATAIGNSAGLFAYHRATSANYTLTARTRDGTGSGWAAADENDWTKINMERVAQQAIEKARRSRNPVAIEPGRYTVVFEPEATANMISLIAGALQARAADEGRSAFAKANGTKVGERLFDARVMLYSDPRDPLVLGSPFDGEGMPLGRQVWVEDGVLRQLAYSRFWASKQGVAPTGSANSLQLRGGDASVDSLIASTERGVLVTRLWYLRAVDQRTLVHTGLTRDGTFLIEDGRVTRPIKNFRFNDSPLFMLNNLDGIGVAERTAGGGNIVMPALKVRDFHFTSLSDAV